MSRTFRDLVYERQNSSPQAKDTYEILLEQVRAAISQDHAETLAHSITEKDEAEAVKRLISEYVSGHQLHISGLSMPQLAERLYGDMAGFGFLDKYITDPEIEEINGNSWRDIEIMTRSGWRKVPEHFLSSRHAEDTLRKMVRLGGLVLDGTNPIVDSYITEGIRVSAMIPPVSDKLSRMLISTDASGNSTYYVYGVGLIGHQDASGYSIYHFDLRGSTVALTDVNGAVTDRYTYGAYGELLTHTGSSDTPFLYCGQYGVMKDANGLYYMRARYYAPEIKRFLNVDPKKGSLIDSKTLNNYGYVSGNPIANIDQEGTFWFLIAAGIGALIGVASTFIGDVVENIATGGKSGFSSWETYVGSAVEGAVEGALDSVGAVGWSSVVGSAVSNATKQGLELAAGDDEDGLIDVGELTQSAVIGAAFSKVDIKIKGVNSGSHSWKQVFKSGVTNMVKRGYNMSAKTIAKGFGAYTIPRLASNVAQDLKGRVVDYAIDMISPKKPKMSFK